MSKQVSVPHDPVVTPAKRSWWLSGGFGKLFVGQTVSAVGSQVTFMALPLIAVLTMHADAAAMGVLGALDNLPYLLVGLWVGVFVDRHARRRLMIASDLLRALAVVSVPVAALAGWLTFAQLCVVAFVVGIGNIVFDVSSQAQLPELVDDDRLVAANGALQTSASLAQVASPGLVGVLIRFAGAPVALLMDVASYLVSAVSIRAIRQPEHPRPSPDGSNAQQVAAGLRVVRRDPRLVGIAGGASAISLAMNAAMAVLMLYLAERFGMDAAMIGLVFLAFGVGGGIGAVTVSPAADRLGAGRVLSLSPLVGAVGLVACVVAGTASMPPAWTMVVLFGGAVVMGAGLLGFSVLAAGVRQSLAPAALRGRVLGTLRFLEWGSMPLGSVIGGAVGQAFGAGPALAVSALLVASASVWVVATPLRRLADVRVDAA